jgi:broad-specificity NMP kinase
MKKLIVINGAMGVGKTSLCKELIRRLPNSVRLDGDWCMMTHPWRITEANQKTFFDNLHYLLNGFLSNPTFEYVLFSWVIPREDLLNYIVKALRDNRFELVKITLPCADDPLKERMPKAGRDAATVEKSMLYQKAYQEMDTLKVDTTTLSLSETADEVNNAMRGVTARD